VAEAGQRLGQLLMRAGVITERQLNDALEVYNATGSPIGRVLVDLGYASQGAILSVMAKQIGIEYIDFEDVHPSPAAVALVSRDLAARYTLIPIELRDGVLVVAMADPQNVLALDDLRIITGHDIKPAISTKDDIVAAIGEYYKVAEQGDVDLLGDAEDAGEQDLAELIDVVEEAPAVKLVNYIIQKAVADRASDIHIEPQEQDLRVRFRVDGVLHEAMPPAPKSIQTSIISRFKIMAEMDIAESRKPQDGHSMVVVDGHRMDFRVSTLPTVYGERIVLRILRTDSILLQLTDLGFLDQSLERFETSFKRPYGAILVTGPTGSGKSTTLYAAINVLNDPSRHIITAEDPVEYRLPGINQCQVSARAGLTFSRALRSFLRCSPDVILVGEIRDEETAKIAIESALTGHLVLSTLHTNDSAGAVTRLIEMGVEPFLVSSAVDCVLAQRLARKLCSDCKEEWRPKPEVLIEAGFAADNLPETVFRAKGCKKCGGTGYRGRVGVHEVLMMTEEISRLCVENATADEIKQTAVEQGMLTLRQDGLEKVRAGLTSVEEVVRVIV
jgi:type IV pilus assembly protein PilB